MLCEESKASRRVFLSTPFAVDDIMAVATRAKEGKRKKIGTKRETCVMGSDVTELLVLFRVWAE